MSKEIYVVNCYTCQHNGQETCKGCNTLLNGDVEPYENWELREDLSQKDQRIAELEQDLEFTTKTANELIEIKHKLEQELAELKEKDSYHLRYELAGADETITNLRQQLEESFTEKDVEGLIEDRNKIIKFLQKELAEKTAKLEFANKEIERLKASNCYIHDLHNNLYREYQKKNDELYKNQTQLDQANERLKKETEERQHLQCDYKTLLSHYNNLKESAIVPRFKRQEIVYCLSYGKIQLFNVVAYLDNQITLCENRETGKLEFVNNDYLCINKQEAQEKLKEIQGNE